LAVGVEHGKLFALAVKLVSKSACENERLG
jgi:hypothetical protein